MDGTVSLNAFLQPTNAPVGQANSFVNGFDFSTNYARDSVNAFHIRNFNFNSGSGGTLVLGGTVNGNGFFQLKNSGGSVIVTGDNTGLTVTDGSITVKNSSGSATLDGLGIVSTQNFSNVNTSQAAGLNQQITGTADTLFTSGSLNIINTRAVNVLLLLNSSAYMVQTPGTNTGNGVIKIKIDGTEKERVIVDSGVVSDLSTGAHYLVSNLASGTHPFTITGNVNTLVGNGGTMIVYKYRMTYVLLGT
jgi:hypothetical protein